MFSTYRLRREKKIGHVKADGKGEKRRQDHRSGQKTAPAKCSKGATCEGKEVSIRAKVEIDVLRRIVFEMTVAELEELVARLIDDQEAQDYLHWLIKRQEML
jgi:Mn-containing catalase